MNKSILSILKNKLVVLLLLGLVTISLVPASEAAASTLPSDPAATLQTLSFETKEIKSQGQMVENSKFGENVILQIPIKGSNCKSISLGNEQDWKFKRSKNGKRYCILTSISVTEGSHIDVLKVSKEKCSDIPTAYNVSSKTSFETNYELTKESGNVCILSLAVFNNGNHRSWGG